ncbi:MAG: glycosyltransferase family 61 protein [Alphaproteobacteria bacterium]|nr:glycosyltransferase family 61 protein [Alphaproteobacteria bacterium]
MAFSSFRLISVDTVCRRVESIAEVPGLANSLFRPPYEPTPAPRDPEFFDAADTASAGKLASVERSRETFGIGFDDSRDRFFARLDDVIVERRSVYETECFRIFIDRGVALSEPYNAHYKADWPQLRSVDTITLDVNGTAVPVYLHHEIEPEVVIEQPAFFLVDRRASNYYHWMCEVLPRLWAKEALPELAAVPLLVNDGGLNSFQQQTLRALAGSAPLLPFSWRCARFKRLYVPSFLTAGETGRRLRPWFRHLRSRLGSESRADRPRRIYVSRAGAKQRRVVNDAEVVQSLKGLGFESVTLESMSVADQLALFANAEAVVLPHGAAGANLPAAPPGTLVVECHASALLSPAYWLLANAMEQPYGLVVSGPPLDGKSDYEADMVVDPAKLRRVVEAGLAASRPRQG